MTQLLYKVPKGLIPTERFFGLLSEKFDRTPTHLRVLYPVDPACVVKEGRAYKHYFTKEEFEKAVQHFEANPPKGSGRPKGS